MRVPIRKGGKYTYIQPDPHITQEKFNELNFELEKIIKTIRPVAIREVKRLSELGDFSENAEYQIAKGRLRGLNQRIDDIHDQLKNVHIIKPPNNSEVIQIGHTVKIEVNGQQKTFQILGSSESAPLKGIISHKSPLGAALLGHRISDVVKVVSNNKTINYKIIKIL